MLGLRSYFPRENFDPKTEIYLALANAQAARILAPVNILIVNFN